MSKNDTPRIPPNRLRELREAARLTAAEVAKLLDIAVATVSRHESSDRSLSEQMIKKYADLFKVPTHQLFFTAFGPDIEE